MLLGMASTAVGIQLLWWLCLPAVIHSLEIFPFVFLVAYNLHPCHLFPPRFRLSVLEAVTRYFQINLSLFTPCTLPTSIMMWSLGPAAILLPMLLRLRKPHVL